MGVSSPLSSVLSFLLGEEASASGLGEMGVADLERRLEGIVGEESEGTAGKEKERKNWRRGKEERGKAFL